MADAIGLAASVAGLVSLGLQLAEGIESYIGAVNDRKEELATVSTNVRHMKSSIDILKNGTPVLSASPQAASSATISARKTCEEELQALAIFLQGLLDFPAHEHEHGYYRNSIRQQEKKFTAISSIDNSVSVMNSKIDKSSENMGMKDLMVTTSEKTEAQYNAFATTLSVLSADTVCQSNLERADLKRIEAKIDQALEARLQNILDRQNDGGLKGRRLDANELAFGRLFAVSSDLKHICDEYQDGTEDQNSIAIK
ncbi:hypothetical protein VM1G_01926 [Cytospora mali]|uniref:Fungal N-terminal domain-containing protein n=1 Tax=Cytospora mali TaxID=578113 RepID=A0A194VP12_CYTMA|nr:hypothetical protein VM1G_01926 [Valsa mali]